MLTDAIQATLHRYPFARGRSRLTQAISKWSLPPPAAVVPFDGDLQIELCEEQFVSRQIFWFGSFEPYESAVFKNAVRKGMTVVDVGANIGLYTLLAAKRVGPRGRVHAFEPASRTFAVLERNVLRAGFGDRVRLNKIALGAAPRQAELVLTPDGGSNWLCDGEDAKAAKHHPTERVDCESLDEYLHGNRLDAVHLIKIDVEGSDLEVLEGAAETLKKHAPLLFVEFAARCLARFGTTPRELLDFLRALGYRPYAMTVRGAVPWTGDSPPEGNLWLEKG